MCYRTLYPRLMLFVICIVFGLLAWLDQQPGQSQSEPPPVNQLTTYHQQGQGSHPDGFVELNSVVYFVANGTSSASQQTNGLWQTDGTEAGTTVVKAIPNISVSTFQRVGGLLYFKVGVPFNSSSMSYRLWRSDGTAEGTFPLQSVAYTSYTGEYAAMGDTVYFVGLDNAYGYELWKTDGTVAGTTLAVDANSGSAHTGPYDLTTLNGLLYFIGYEGETLKLWMSDGTAAGTQVVPDTPPHVTQLMRLNEMLLFGVESGPDSDSDVSELWRYDGDGSASVPIAEFTPTFGWPSLRDFTRFGDRLLFTVDLDEGEVLWQSDGTTAGTQELAVLEPDSNSESISPAAVTDSFFYFKVYDYTKKSDVELWRTDGTTAGTLLLDTYFYDLIISPIDESPTHFVARGDTLYFITHDHELWQSDGTVAGTVQIETPPVKNLAAVGDGFYLSLFEQAVGFELGYSDGTTAGTRLIKDIDPSYVGADAAQVVPINGRVYSVLAGERNGTPQVWMSENASTPATLVDDAYTFYQLYKAGNTLFVRGADTTGQTLLVANNTTNQLDALQTFAEIELRLSLGNQILFTVFNEATDDYALWRSDGTAAGTVMLIESLRLEDSSFGLNYRIFTLGDHAVIKNGQTYWRTDGTEAGTTSFDMSATTGGGARFVAEADTVFYVESESWLWRSDGTADGTVRLGTERVGDARRPNPVGNALFFQYGQQLWYHDGISTDVVQLTTGTALGAGIRYPFGIPRELVGETLYFARSAGVVDGEVNSELWKSDGTVAGTQLVKTLGPVVESPSDPYPGPSLHSLPSLLFYMLYDNDQGWSLGRSDGTEAGTVLLDDSFSTRFSSEAAYFAATNTHILFYPRTATYGQELWTSDGTVDGTGLLKDIFPGSGSAYNYQRLATDRYVFFVADDGEHGAELWRSDGTTEGTQMVVDLNPGPIGANISILEWSNGILYFSGNNGEDGQQLFSFVTISPRSLPPDEEPTRPDAEVNQVFLPYVNR